MTAVLAILVLASFSFKAFETKSVDTEKSSVKWTGYHLAKSYEHMGSIGIKSGSIEMDGDMITGGSIVIDMNSITNSDLEGEKKTKLEGHLKSDNFFNVEEFPEAKLMIKSATKSGDTYAVTADIVIRGISQEIMFDAKKNGNMFEATFSVDRTVHEVSYGWTLENAMLSNEFQLEVSLALN